MINDSNLLTNKKNVYYDLYANQKNCIPLELVDFFESNGNQNNANALFI